MSAGGVPDEVEVKLDAASAAALRRIAAARTLGAYRLAPRGAARLHTIYLDTADHALTRAGVALRLRRTGRTWEASAKWSGRVDGTLHARPELTVALSGEPAAPFTLPDGPLRVQLSAVVLGRPLRPLLVSDVHRVLRDVRPADSSVNAEPLAELALDTVVLHAPDGRLLVPTYHEVEIERRSGEPSELAALGELLQARFGLTPSPASKFARGAAALAMPLGAPGAAPIAVGDSVAAAIRKIVAAELARMRAEDPGARRGDDPDALHRERVAIRRLRAALRAFAFAMPPRLHAVLTGELRWLGAELGTVRDLDVQLANLAGRCLRADPETRRCLRPFRRHLERERQQRRTRLLAALDSRRYVQLLRALERFAAGAPPRRPRGDGALPVAGAARRAVKRALRRLVRSGDAVAEIPKPEDLHALRIRAKRLRYLLDAVAPLTGKPGRQLGRELVRLQDVLGRFHDAIVAAGFLRAYRDAQVASTDAALRRILTEAADDELRGAGIAQAEFARTWRRFTDKRRRQRQRRTLRHLKAAARAAGGAPG